jgi:hypothetical protein
MPPWRVDDAPDVVGGADVDPRAVLAIPHSHREGAGGSWVVLATAATKLLSAGAIGVEGDLGQPASNSKPISNGGGTAGWGSPVSCFTGLAESVWHQRNRILTLHPPAQKPQTAQGWSPV